MGQTALSLAVLSEDAQIVKTLLSLGADPQVPTVVAIAKGNPLSSPLGNCTPSSIDYLLISATGRRVSMVQWLLHKAAKERQGTVNPPSF